MPTNVQRIDASRGMTLADQLARQALVAPDLVVYTPSLGLIGYNKVDSLRAADDLQSQALVTPAGQATPGQQFIAAGTFQTVAEAQNALCADFSVIEPVPADATTCQELYGLFVAVQTVRHRDYFLPVTSSGRVVDGEDHADPPSARAALTSLGLLLLALVAVVGEAKAVSPAIESGVDAAGFPPSFVGVVCVFSSQLPS